MKEIKTFARLLIIPREREPINWRKLQERKRISDYGEVSRDVKSLTKEIFARAKAKQNFKSANIVEALVFLGLSKEKATKQLTEIFVAQRRSEEEALQIAKSQINMLWDAAVRRKATLEKFKKERELLVKK